MATHTKEVMQFEGTVDVDPRPVSPVIKCLGAMFHCRACGYRRVVLTLSRPEGFTCDGESMAPWP